MGERYITKIGGKRRRKRMRRQVYQRSISCRGTLRYPFLTLIELPILDLDGSGCWDGNRFADNCRQQLLHLGVCNCQRVWHSK
jgi:hypothetical protein